MKHQSHILVYGAIAIMIAVGLLLFSVVWEMLEPTHVLEKSCQPKNINYESFDPYCIAILQKGDDYSIFVGRDSKDFPEYGHLITHPYNESYSLYGKDDTFDWSDQGITWTGNLGHTLFIPAELFTGGR